MKTRRLYLVLVLLFGFSLLVHPALAGITTISLSFDEDQVMRSTRNGYDLLEIKSEDCRMHGVPGAPFLPVKSVKLAIPANAKVKTVAVESQTSLLGIYNLLPTQITVRPGARADFVPPDPAYYTRAFKYPAQAVKHVRTGSMRGYTLTTLNVYPLQYIPAQRQVFLNRELTITVEWVERPLQPAPSYASDPSFQGLVEGFVANPEDVERTAPGFTASPLDMGNEIKYLIITNQGLASAFQPLADWKTKKGLPATVITTETIYSSYPGADGQEKIKRCILDYAENYGALWVLLGGDDSIVPDRDCYGQVGSEKDSTIPTDLYYAGLDDLNWNDNGGSPCELSDTIDMEPDVFVGRAPLRTSTETAAFVSKTITYDKASPSTNFAEKMILMGAKLWTYSGGYSDAYWKTEKMYTQNIDPWWDFTRYMFYDTATSFPGGASYELNATNVRTQLNSGYNFIFMGSHGDWNLWKLETGSYYNTNAAQLTNGQKQGHIYTIACLTNAFDREPSLSESFIRNATGGAVSYIGCSRFGWDYVDPMVHGPSYQYADRFYYDLFTGTPSNYVNTLGAVFSAHKYDLVNLCDTYDAWRWLQFGLNLMGDPELSVYTEDPETFTVTHSSFTTIGPQTFSVATGVPEALVCFYKGTEVYAYGKASQEGIFSADINPSTFGVMYVTVSRYNYRSYEGMVTVYDTPPVPLPVSSEYGMIKGGDQSHANEVLYSFEGTTGNVVIEYEVYDIDSGNEVQILINGQRVGYAPLTPNLAWGGPFTIVLPDSMVNDAAINTLVFDNTFNPPRVLWWGVRNVAIQSSGVPGGISLPAVDAYGMIKDGDQNHADQVTYWFEGRSGSVVVEYEAYDIDSAKEVQILINGQRAGYVAITPNLTWGGPFTIVLPDGMVNDAAINTLVFDNTFNPPKVLWWGIRNAAIQ